MNFESILDEELARCIQEQEQKEALAEVSAPTGAVGKPEEPSGSSPAPEMSEDEKLARQLQADFDSQMLAELLSGAADVADGPSLYAAAIPALETGSGDKKRWKGKKKGKKKGSGQSTAIPVTDAAGAAAPPERQTTLLDTTPFVTKHDPALVSARCADGYDRFVAQQTLDGSGTVAAQDVAGERGYGDDEDDDADAAYAVTGKEDPREIESLPPQAYNMLREHNRRAASEKIERERHGRKQQKAAAAVYKASAFSVADIDSYVPSQSADVPAGRIPDEEPAEICKAEEEE